MSRADDLATALGLAPHPEGGAYRETWRARAAAGEGRALATAIAFLLRRGEVSRWHRVTSDELWLHQGGDPMLLRRISPAGVVDDAWLGLDVAAGQAPQLLVPAGWWQASIPAAEGPHGFCLLGCVVAPGFEFADFTLADEAEMAARFPALAGKLGLAL
jgi:predicted cupin superfamily sugar epimerase